MKALTLSRQKRCLEIIEDTLEFYKKNPRAVNEFGQCSYIDGNGNRCAVGRYISEEHIKQVNEKPFNGQSVDGLHNEWELDTILIDTARGLDIDFWSDLQHLHDSRKCWNGNKLTKFGREQSIIIKAKWAPDLITPKRNTRTKK